MRPAKCLWWRYDCCGSQSTPQQEHHQQQQKQRLNFCARSTAVYFVTLRALIVLSRLTLLAPIGRCRTNGYHTHAVLSTCAAGVCLALTVAAPWLIRTHTSVYGISDMATDARFEHIALICLCSDFTVSLLILAAQAWQRRQLVSWLNAFNGIISDLQRWQRQFIGWRYTFVLWLGIGHFVYGFSMNWPFLIRHSDELHASSLFACSITLIVEQLSRIFALGVMATLLLFTACYAQLQRYVEAQWADKMLEKQQEKQQQQQGEEADNQWQQQQEELHNLLNALQSQLRHFIATFELGIFLLLIGQFINVLANLYGLVYHSVYTGSAYPNLIAYNLSLAINLYSLIFCAHLCNQQCERTRHAILTLPGTTTSTSTTITTSTTTTVTPLNGGNGDDDWQHLSYQCDRYLVHSHPNWPVNVPLSILGLFHLNHEFWLVLIAYAGNFIVIILQFAIEERQQSAVQTSATQLMMHLNSSNAQLNSN